MDKYWGYLLLACLVVLFIISLMGLLRNPQIKSKIERFLLVVVKPFLKKAIKQFIIDAEIAMQENEKMGVEKMASVVMNTLKKLPPPLRNYITQESVQLLCQGIYDKMQDVLAELKDGSSND